MARNELYNITVAYASPTAQRILTLSVEPGTTIESAIILSGMLQLFPEINLTRQKVGVFSKSRLLSDIVQEGDQIEIYRSLLIDPMEARRAKAKARR